jgi:hypothetical protein
MSSVRFVPRVSAPSRPSTQHQQSIRGLERLLLSLERSSGYIADSFRGYDFHPVLGSAGTPFSIDARAMRGVLDRLEQGFPKGEYYREHEKAWRALGIQIEKTFAAQSGVYRDEKQQLKSRILDQLDRAAALLFAGKVREGREAFAQADTLWRRLKSDQLYLELALPISQTRKLTFQRPR